jgi:NADH dehydrogenase
VTTRVDSELHVVTGAFGYSGKYIARRLLDAGHMVCTLTNSVHRDNPFANAVKAKPYDFDHPAGLARSLEGAKVLYNTYWVRFDHADFTHSEAVRNSLALFRAAREAGVERVVHVSITNPSAESQLPYFRGKAELESALKESGLSFAVLRPTVLFGKEDVLVNNIAWMLRRFPVFGVFGDGLYKIQPIFVDDLAALAVAWGQSRENATVDAIGPETFTYRELVETVGAAIGCRRPLMRIPPRMGYLISKLVGAAVGDVLVTREEIAGLMENRLYTNSPPAGRTALSDWLEKHAKDLGRQYSSEMARRRNRTKSCDALRDVA